MKTLLDFEPQAVWKFFDLICSIPHPSGHEAALADRLAGIAVEHGLSVRRDDAGNLRIDRKAAPGFENRPTILLQAHLDMVPVADDPGFDFLTMPISTWIDGDWLRAKGTALGADNGIGVALAMAVLCEPDLKCGALAGIFTVDEEVGLTGASALAGELLEGKYLLNLDGGPDGDACIGCAGGGRTEFDFVPEYESEVSGHPVQIALSGLPGGHSGICIHENRGNAVKALSDFLLEHPEIRLSSFEAGGADNAIPAEGVVSGCFDGDFEALQQSAVLAGAVLGRELARDGIKFTVTALSEMPEKVWSRDFQHRLLVALSLAPNGVMKMDEQLNIVHTSSNLAAVFFENGSVRVRSSQRSLDDEQRELTTGMLSTHFASFGASAAVGNCYPGWTPQQDSKLVRVCAELWEKRSGQPMSLRAIHAGLETGAFCKKNPDLELISIGPEAHGCHTPAEHLSIASTERFYDYLVEVITALD